MTEQEWLECTDLQKLIDFLRGKVNDRKLGSAGEPGREIPGGRAMTEAEWEKGAEPTAILEFLFGRVSNRKLRLFGVACCRRIWHLFSDGRSREAVEVAERLADGVASQEELAAACTAANAANHVAEALAL